ncbi:hypothetical protein [Yeosuana aromativorans]|nr:hypothetical protein [Yeosuana aromativorans]
MNGKRGALAIAEKKKKSQTGAAWDFYYEMLKQPFDFAQGDIFSMTIF